jgi:Zn-dependent protease
LLLLVAGFGWAKPVPVNPYVLNRRSPSAFMWVSLAGPLSNLLMAVLAAIPLRFGLIQYQIPTSKFIPTAYEFAIEFIIINLALMLFNLIPLAPLDGEKVLDFFLPQNLQQGWNKIKQYGPIILLALIFVLPMIGIDLISMVLTPALSGLLRVLIGGY